MTIKHLKFRNEDRNISPDSLLDELVGKFLEMELEKEYTVSLKSNANWGYCFRIKINQINYYIITEFQQTPKYLQIRIIPSLNFFQKWFKKNYETEQNKLAEEILKLVKESYPNLSHTYKFE